MDKSWQATTIHSDDDVAVALAPLTPGETRVRRGTETITLSLRDEIPMGHKLSLRAVAAGAPIRKYGEAIGVATADIEAGRHVHVHNVRSQRARVKTGDSP